MTIAINKLLVTGSSSGIGLAITKKLLDQNASVIGVSRTCNDELLKHPNYTHFNCDLSNLSEVHQLAQTLLEQHSDIQGIVFSAGYGVFKQFEKMEFDEIEHIMNVHIMSSLAITHSLIAQLKAHSRSHLIFIGSESTVQGKKMGVTYCAAKYAVRGLAQSLTEECAQSSVYVSIIEPGIVRTSFYDDLSFEPGEKPQHAIDPDDIAKVVISVLQMSPCSSVDEIIINPKSKHIRLKTSNH